jgi:ribonuclease E
MLINAQNPEEVRIAIVDEDKLEDFQVEVAEGGSLRGNVYRGTVVSIQPSLNAAFINFGAQRNGFLSMADINPAAYAAKSGKGDKGDNGWKRITDVIHRGQPIIVQVTRDAEGQKGAALTTYVSLAGRYVVLAPFDDTRGVSRKVEDDDVRRKLKEQVENLDVPEGFGYIVRTAALDQTKTTLKRDFSSLTRMWKKILSEAKKGEGPKLLYQDQDIVLRSLRDYLESSIEEVVIDDAGAMERASDYVRTFMSRSKTRLIHYQERAPLFSHHGIEDQVDRIYDRQVPLPSGGSIVIDRTEALIAIDVNSGRSLRGGSQEETAVHTNAEAAAEVARQLRLRDLGGLIVVDFIDMRSPKHRTRIEKELQDALKNDKARTTVGRLSPNGLLEINRQRIRQALHLRTHRHCPTCEGTGRIASVEVVGLNLLRKIETRAVDGRLDRVRIALHPELADAVQNGRRRQIAGIEQEFGVSVEIIASNRLHRPEQEIEWFEREVVVKESDLKSEPRKVITTPAPAPSRPAEAAAVAAPPDEAGRKKKRKRRRRKGGAAEDAPIASEGPEASATEAEDAYSDVREGSESPGSEADDAHSDVRRAGVPITSGRSESSATEAVAPEAGNGEETTAGKRKRRRRRRRGGGATAAAGAGAATIATPLTEPEEEPPHVSDEQQGQTEPHARDEVRKKSRRRRGRRGDRAATHPGQQAAGAAAGEGAASRRPDVQVAPVTPAQQAVPAESGQSDAGHAEKGPGKRSRRRRGKGHRAEAGVTPEGGPTAAPVESVAPAERPQEPDRSARPDDGSEAAAKEAPAKKPAAAKRRPAARTAAKKPAKAAARGAAATTASPAPAKAAAKRSSTKKAGKAPAAAAPSTPSRKASRTAAKKAAPKETAGKKPADSTRAKSTARSRKSSDTE